MKRPGRKDLYRKRRRWRHVIGKKLARDLGIFATYSAGHEYLRRTGQR